MLEWFRALMPREEKFFVLYARHAALVVEAAQELEAMLGDGADLGRHCNRIIQLEHQADDITREVMQAVRKSFITPFDRSDVTGLIQSMDDAVDKMQRVVKTIQLYELDSFEPGMRAMASAAVQASRMMAETVDLLPRINANASRIATLTESIVRLEAEADDLHDAGLKTLYREHGKSEPVRFFIGRQLYIDLEGVVDSIEDVANEITSITIENV
jgi:predicted phosphate transport protein (TIGR00153 family)